METLVAQNSYTLKRCNSLILMRILMCLPARPEARVPPAWPKDPAFGLE